MGKSHILQALGQKACVHGYRVLYRTSAKLISDLTASLADKTLPEKLRRYARPDFLIIDAFGCDLIERQESPQSAHLLYKIIDLRNQRKSTALATNVDFEKWGTISPMALSPWLSSIASWKKPSSSRFKVSPIVHTAQRRRTNGVKGREVFHPAKQPLDRLQGTYHRAQPLHRSTLRCQSGPLFRRRRQLFAKGAVFDYAPIFFRNLNFSRSCAFLPPRLPLMPTVCLWSWHERNSS